MRLSLNKVFVLAAAVLLVSCSGYNKILKSSDYELKYKTALSLYEQEKYARAQALFDDMGPYFSGTDREDSVAYYTGVCYYKQGDFYTSGEKFDEFRRKYGRSPFLEDVEYMYAKGFYYLSPGPERDQTATNQALMAISEYLSRYPNSVKKELLLEHTNELRQKLYDKAYLNAKVYYKIGYYNSAVVALKNAIDAYPESNHREELSYLIVKSHFLYAKNSVSELQRERFLNMQDAYYSFVAEYPESPYRKELDKMQEYAKRFLTRFSEEGTVKHVESEDETGREDKKAEKQFDLDMKGLSIEEQKAGKIKGERLENPEQKNRIENKDIDNGNQEK